MIRRVKLALIALLAFVPLARAADDSPAAAGGADGAKVVVPVFKLSGPLTESPAAEELPIFANPSTSLKDLIDRMGKAAKDPAVKTVVVVSESAQVGLGQIEEIRQAMGKIRAAGKDVYVHADSAQMASYVLYTAASRLSMTPTADLWVGGLHGEQPYIRGLLDKIGVEPEILTCGEYKSAGEMFTRTGPSKQADEMHNWLFDSIYASWINDIATSRKLTPEQVRERIDVGLYSAERAKAAGLIDAVEHREDFEDMLRKKLGGSVSFDRKYGKPADKQLDLSSPMALFKIWAELLGGAKKHEPTGPSVAIIYVEGMIVPGSKQPSPFGGGNDYAMSSDIRAALNKAAEDDNVKAVVLRIDSPGGSAVASEIILNATQRVAAKKPFVVSMGNVAGSGGYYVACGTDTIFADETTITGSIGVFSGKMVTNPMWEKIGITFKEYNRGKNAGLLASSSKFTDDQRQHLQSWMDEVYGVFKGHVTAARGSRLKKPLDEIAGGRVYTGQQALELGLVDQIGTMSDAVKFVAKKANLQGDYAVRVVPEPKNFVEALMEGISGDKSGEDTKHVQMMSTGAGSISELALPYLKQLDPQKVSVIRSALQRLDLMQQENVILAMPEFQIGQ